MSQSIVFLNNVFVQKGFEGKSPVTYRALGDNGYGTMSFKVSNKKQPKKQGEKAEYDNYTIDVSGVKADSKLITILSNPGVKVSIHGDLTLEEYNGKKFMKVSCHSKSIDISSFGDEKKSESPNPPFSDNGL